MSKEGFWAVNFSGAIGTGFGVLVLDTGIAIGADVVGGQFDGTYTYDSRADALLVEMTMTVPKGVQLVTGAPVQAQDYKVPLKFQVSRTIGKVTYFDVDVMGATVNVQMVKIRDFPS